MQCNTNKDKDLQLIAMWVRMEWRIAPCVFVPLVIGVGMGMGVGAWFPKSRLTILVILCTEHHDTTCLSRIRVSDNNIQLLINLQCSNASDHEIFDVIFFMFTRTKHKISDSEIANSFNEK